MCELAIGASTPEQPSRTLRLIQRSAEGGIDSEPLTSRIRAYLGGEPMHTSYRLALVLGLLLTLTGAGPRVAAANTPIVVTSTADEPDAAPGNGVCASGTSGQCTLRAAIMEANALPGTDTLTLPAGLYALTQAGAGENAATTGDLDILGDLTITGATSATTIIDGQHLDRVFQITNTAIVTLQNLAIQNGTAFSPTLGGGLLNWNSSVALVNSRVSENEAASHGGLSNISGTLTILNSTVLSNVATYGDGGGVGNNYGVVVLTNTQVSYNEALYALFSDIARGAGISSWEGISVSLYNTTLSHNQGRFGAGLWVIGGGQITIDHSTIFSNTNQGLSLNGGEITVVDSVIAENNILVDDGLSGLTGAGIANNYAQLSIVRTQIISNTAAGAEAGGIRNYSGQITITASLIRGNQSDKAGGALLSDSSTSSYPAVVSIENSEISNNASGMGGTLDNSGDLAHLHINASRIVGNQASIGGGIFNTGYLAITGSVILSNTATQYGGGGVFNNKNAQLTNVALARNATPQAGGGLENWGWAALTNVTLSGNQAGYSGGGIYADGPMTLTNVTVVNNTADSGHGIGDGNGGDGGGIYVDSGLAVLLRNSILSNNHDLSLERPNCSVVTTGYPGLLASDGYNLLADNTGCEFAPTDGDQVGTGASPLDPLLGPLADNGGATLTHALLPGSPALDAGNPAGCTDALDEPLLNDQRGYVRPVDGDADNVARCDIGAYEWLLSIVRLYVPLLLR
jgi:large repetitive protein